VPVGLKIDVFSSEVAESLPDLLKLLDEYQLKATFFPQLADISSGFFSRFLDTGKPQAVGGEEIWLALKEAGHEIGALPSDAGLWQQRILDSDARWTRSQIKSGRDAYQRLFGEPPKAFAAPGFLINADTPVIEAALGFTYAVDTRGVVPYRPRNGGCLQLPVTLLSIDEALQAGEPAENLHQFLFMESQKPLVSGHVFNFTPAGSDHLAVLEKLIVMWMGSQRNVMTLSGLLAEAGDEFPTHDIGMMCSDSGVARYAAQGDRSPD